MSPDEVMSLLSAQKTGALATIGKDGFPHQAAMWFISEPGHILMWTYRRSQKAVNLRRDRRASFMVEDGETYDTLRGVLVQGEVELVDDAERVLDIGLRLPSLRDQLERGRARLRGRHSAAGGPQGRSCAPDVTRRQLGSSEADAPGTRSLRSRLTRPSISSLILRTSSTLLPAGSSTTQSS